MFDRAESRRKRRLGRTPAFRGPDGNVLPGSVAEISFRPVGGVPQWVMVRGEDTTNPPLILLHGGPGMGETSLFRYFNSPLEADFTVVYWDQRNAGKSFRPGMPRSSLTVERFVTDLDELVDSVRAELGHEKVAIFGHSWGSALGAIYSARFPDKVAAYVGSGQIGDWAASERGTYAYAVAEARRLGKRRISRKLEAIGPPPHDPAALWTQRTCLSRVEGRMRPKSLWEMGRTVVRGEESTIFEFGRAMRNFRVSLDAMWAEVSTLNLLELAPEFGMPVFFFLGRNDHWVPPETSVDYFDLLSAPFKKLVWFEHSGHEPFMDEPAKFNTAMAELVRPVLTPAVPA